MLKVFLALGLVLATIPTTQAAAAPAASQAAEPTLFSVTVEGAGPDIVMIPGLVSSRAVWNDAVASLGGKYRVHRLQVGGFAGEPVRAEAGGKLLRTIVDQLHAYIAANKLERPRVVGHSLGGLIALMLADAHPGDVGGVMVVDALPFYPMLFAPEATAAAVEPRAAAMRDAMTGMTAEAYAAQQPAVLASLVRDEGARVKVLQWSLASDRNVAAEAVYEDMVTDMRPRVAGIKAPLTIVYAVNEVATEERYGALYRLGYAAAPEVTFVPVADAYHFLMLDQPAAFAAALRDFVGAKN